MLSVLGSSQKKKFNVHLSLKLTMCNLKIYALKFVAIFHMHDFF